MSFELPCIFYPCNLVLHLTLPHFPLISRRQAVVWHVICAVLEELFQVGRNGRQIACTSQVIRPIMLHPGIRRTLDDQTVTQRDSQRHAYTKKHTDLHTTCNASSSWSSSCIYCSYTYVFPPKNRQHSKLQFRRTARTASHSIMLDLRRFDLSSLCCTPTKFTTNRTSGAGALLRWPRTEVSIKQQSDVHLSVCMSSMTSCLK